MKIRKGWKLIWENGTEWLGDCPVWAAQLLPPGARIVPIRLMGPRRGPCNCPGGHS
jgi:hypothetical protein